jgi:serine/threonine-protein kinase
MAEIPQRIGKYDVRGLLGAGAMAVVYQAYDPVIERTLAIKVVDKRRLDESESESVLSRFRVEARAAGRLHHPNIVAVYDCGEDGELVFLAMECVFGRPLTAFLQGEDFRGEPDKVCEIMLQVLGALSYSHAQGVIHRDIKPSNIMVSREGVIKIADFGVARIESSHLTQTGDLIGTPSYMAPEQFAGERADARTDLYGASVIFYELLTRRRPFEGPNNAVIMHRVFTETPAPPSRVNPLLSAALDDVVLQGMAKEPGERFQSAREYENAVRAAMAQGLLAESRSEPSAGPKIASNLLKAVRAKPAGEAAPAAAPASTSPGTATLPAVPAAARRLLGEDPTLMLPSRDARQDVTLLFVDDEVRILTALQALFRTRYRVQVCDDPRKAVEMIKSTQFHVLISDQRMPGMLGVDLLRQAREISPRTVRILLTGYSDLASIVGSINDGEVWRFINKPWDAQDIQNTIAEAVALATEVPEVPAWQMPAPPRYDEAVLALDPADDLTPLLLSSFGEQHWVARARDVEEAVQVMREREVAVLVADLDTDHARVKTLLHLVKREFPQILSLGITEAVDAEVLIELINQTQVYRFLNKPVSARQLEEHVRAALNRYRTYQATPALARVVQQVQAPKEPAPAAGGLLERLKSIRSRFGTAR